MENNNLPQPKEMYEHYKGGTYKIVDLNIDADTNDGKLRVNYISLYDSPKYPKGTSFSSSLERFCETIELNGNKIKRFTKIN